MGSVERRVTKAVAHDSRSQDDIDAPLNPEEIGIFDIESTESIGDVLGDKPKTESASGAPQEGVTETQAYTEADFKIALTTLENYALNMSLSESRLIEQAKTLSYPAPKDAKKLSQLPYATLQKLIAWAKDFAAGNS